MRALAHNSSMRKVEYTIGANASRLTGYLHDDLSGYCDTYRRRPAMLIFPGGGYILLSPREEDPAAFPFFASGYRFAHVTGRGEQVEESPGPERMPVILAVPEHKVPTGYAFSVLDAIKRDRTPLPPLTRDIPDKEDFPNDFELIEENACPFIKADGFASLSGSGAVWYLISELFQDEWLEIRGYCVKYKTEFI